MPSRAALLLPLLAACLLGGCGIDWRPVPEGAAAQAQPPPRPPAAEPPPPGQRVIRLRLGDGPPFYAVLLQEQQQRRLWRTETDFALATDGARVVATSGPARVIMATRIDGPDPLAAPEALLAREAPARRLVDLATADRQPAGMLFGIEIACRARASAPEDQPTILLVEEHCRGPSPVGSFTNHFVVRRADGAVLQSQQWIGPDLPPLTVEAVP